MPRSYFSRMVRGQDGEALRPPRPIATMWKAARIDWLASRPAVPEPAPADGLWGPGEENVRPSGLLPGRFPEPSNSPAAAIAVPAVPPTGRPAAATTRAATAPRPRDMENRSGMGPALTPFEAASRPGIELQPPAPMVHTGPIAVEPKPASTVERPFARMDAVQLPPTMPRHRTATNSNKTEASDVPARPTRAATRIPVLDPLPRDIHRHGGRRIACRKRRRNSRPLPRRATGWRLENWKCR